MKFYKITLTILTIGLFLFASCGENPQQENTNPENENSMVVDNIVTVTTEQFSTSGMKLGKITNHSFSEKIQVAGAMDVPPEYKAAVSIYYGGTVKNIHLLVGQKVKKGGVLFTLENPQYIEMQQDFLNAQAKLTYQKSEYERQKKLQKENITSEKKYLKAEADYFSVRSDVKALEKKLRLINISPSKLNFDLMTTKISVRSPISGNVAEVNITKGEYLDPNKVAVKIVSTEHIHLELNVFEKDIHKIKEGQTIKFNLPDNKTNVFEAEVFLVGKTVNSTDRIINIHGHLKNENDKTNFISGMYIQAEILVDEITLPAILEDAIVNADDNNFVLVKKSKNNGEYKFIKQPVKIGKTTNGYTEIINIDEFNKEDELVIKGSFNLIN
ncbi:MAG: efflux RND transporter periplasmic adaptor subunit [Melioribacteraceae bacterium]